MENVIVSKYLKLFELLSLESKIELLSKLTDSIKHEVSPQSRPDKTGLLQELFGAWSDIDEDITDQIYSSRTISDKPINFD